MMGRGCVGCTIYGRSECPDHYRRDRVVRLAVLVAIRAVVDMVAVAVVMLVFRAVS